MKFLLLFAALAMFTTGMLSQSELPGPVKGSITLLHDAKSLKVTFAIQKLSGGVEKATLVYSKEGMYKIETQNKLVESDGKILWTLDKQANTYTEVPASKAPTKEFAVWAWSSFFNDDALKGTKEYAAKPSRTLRGASVTEYNAKMANDKAFTLFLDDKTGVTRGAGNSEFIVLATGDITVGKDALDTKDFTFVPPTDAKKVEKPVGPTYAQVEAVLQANCLPCHSAGNHKAGLSVDAYEGDMAKVVAGNSGNSGLYKSIAGSRANMPQGRAPLSKVDTDLIAAWIDAGAKN